MYPTSGSRNGNQTQAQSKRKTFYNLRITLQPRSATAFFISYIPRISRIDVLCIALSVNNKKNFSIAVVSINAKYSFLDPVQFKYALKLYKPTYRGVGVGRTDYLV